MKHRKVFILSKIKNSQIDNLLKKYKTKDMIFNTNQRYPRSSHWDFCSAFNYLEMKSYNYLTIVEDFDGNHIDMMMLIDPEVIIMDATKNNITRVSKLLDELYIFINLMSAVSGLHQLDYDRVLSNNMLTYHSKDKVFSTIVVANLSDVFSAALNCIKDDYHNKFIPMFEQETQVLRMKYIY